MNKDIPFGLPAGLEYLAGKRILRAWQWGPALILRLEGGLAAVLFVEAEPVAGVRFHVNKENPNITEFDEHAPQTKFTKMAAGRRLIGMDNNVLELSGGVGAEFCLDGIHWVYKGEARTAEGL
jgi:hypothetical protein